MRISKERANILFIFALVKQQQRSTTCNNIEFPSKESNMDETICRVCLTRSNICRYLKVIKPIHNSKEGTRICPHGGLDHIKRGMENKLMQISMFVTSESNICLIKRL